jgi:4-amino-4-deoxy-L-arabinose transferase-like glycosyltransferase
MMADHDWIIPKIGGLPWLERPPLPDWIIIGIASIFGHCDRDWIVRIAPAGLGTLVVVMVAWLASLWYGRSRGLLSGLILASMWEFYSFAGDPEADMFLCGIVTATVALFAHLEFGRRPASAESTAFLGTRPWPVLAFFILLGATNLAKGLIFGTVMAAAPVCGFLLGKGDWKVVRRYVWLWGWLAFTASALWWPLAVYHRYPDSIAVWMSDYGARWNHGYIAQPWWYYAEMLPLVIFPWTLPAGFGLWITRTKARGRYSPERFLWTWALLTPLLFSLPDGKHHHYLLQCMAPWAVLAALGSGRLWRYVQQGPGWLRQPAWTLLAVALPADLLLAAVRSRIPVPGEVMVGLMLAVPVIVLAGSWAITRRTSPLAATALFALLFVVYSAVGALQKRFGSGYLDDRVFLKQVARLIPEGRTCYVAFDERQLLQTFHVLFHTRTQRKLLHNLTYLRDSRILEKDVYVVTRALDAAALTEYGRVDTLLTSAHSPGERSPAERRTLFRIHLDDHLERQDASQVRVSPMQAIHRERGPFLCGGFAVSATATPPAQHESWVARHAPVEATENPGTGLCLR